MLLRSSACQRTVIAVLITALLLLPVPRGAAAQPPTDERSAVWIGPGTTYTTLELAGVGAPGTLFESDLPPGRVGIGR